MLWQNNEMWKQDFHLYQKYATLIWKIFGKSNYDNSIWGIFVITKFNFTIIISNEFQEFILEKHVFENMPPPLKSINPPYMGLPPLKWEIFWPPPLKPIFSNLITPPESRGGGFRLWDTFLKFWAKNIEGSLRVLWLFFKHFL